MPSPGMALVCRELAVTDIIYGGQLIAGSDVGQEADITTHDLGVVRPPSAPASLPPPSSSHAHGMASSAELASDGFRLSPTGSAHSMRGGGGWMAQKGHWLLKGLLDALQEMSEADGFFRALSPSARVLKAALPHYNPHGARRTLGVSR